MKRFAILAHALAIAMLAWSIPGNAWEYRPRHDKCDICRSCCDSPGTSGGQIFETPPAPRSDPTHDAATAAFRQGRQATEEGRYADAEAAYRRVVALEPGNGAAWFNLGNNILRQNDPARYREAVGAFDEAARQGDAAGAREAERWKQWLAEEDRRRNAAAQAQAQAQTQEQERLRQEAEARRRQAEKDAAMRREAAGAVSDAVGTMVDDFVRETGAAPPVGDLAALPDPVMPPPPPVADGAVKSDGKLPTVDPGHIRGEPREDGLRIKEPPPPKIVKPYFDPPEKKFAPRPEDVRSLGSRTGSMVMDAIELGVNDLDKSQRTLEENLKLAPADPDLRDAHSYVLGMNIGKGISGDPRRAPTPEALKRRLGPKPGLDSVAPSVFSPTLSQAGELDRWDAARNRMVLDLLDRHPRDIPAALAEIEARAKQNPGDAAVRGALRVIQGISVYTESGKGAGR